MLCKKEHVSIVWIDCQGLDKDKLSIEQRQKDKNRLRVQTFRQAHRDIDAETKKNKKICDLWVSIRDRKRLNMTNESLI